MTDHRTTPKRSLAGRITGILAKTVLILLLFIIFIFILIQLPPVQNFARKKVQSYLQNKLKTKVQIGSLFIGIPRKVVLGNVYIEDQKHDTLLAGGSLSVKIDMLKLLRNDISIAEVKLDDITAKIKRQLPDTAFNFQFIMQAFSGKKKPKNPADTSIIKMALRSLILNRTRLVYNDVVTGNDVDIRFAHFGANIDTLDITHEHIGIPSIDLRGVEARIHQTQPLAKPSAPTQTRMDSMHTTFFQVVLKTIDLRNIDLDYRNDVSALYTQCKLGELVLRARRFDMNRNIIDLGELQLNNTRTVIRTGKQSAKPKANTKPDTSTTSGPGWRVMVARIRLANNDLSFDNDNAPHAPAGMDYSHLQLQNLTLYVNDLLYSKDSIAGVITKGQMKDRSGFELNTLQTEFLYANNEAYLHNLLLKTPGTELHRSIGIRYASMEALKKDMAHLRLDVDINNSRILVKDILLFAPSLHKQPAFANPNSTWYVNSRIQGTVSNMRIASLQFRGLQHTNVNLHGTIRGLPAARSAIVNLNIHALNTSYGDLKLLLPPKALPDSLQLPNRMALKGTLVGGMADITTDLNLDTDMGNILVKGNLKNITDSIRASYNVFVRTTDLDVGAILRKTQQLGAITASIQANGRGLTPKTANAHIKGTIDAANVKQYNYRNLTLDGSMANQQLHATAAIQDPNIRMQMTANGSMAGKFPAIRLVTTIDSIRTQPLHLTTNPIMYKGTINADFPVTDPDHLQGQLTVSGMLQMSSQRPIALDTIRLVSGSSDTGQFLRLSSKMATVALQGRYRLTQLGTVFQQAIRPYFNTSSSPSSSSSSSSSPPSSSYSSYSSTSAQPAKPADPYNFTVTARIQQTRVLIDLVPNLKQMEDVTINGHFADSNRWQASLSAPLIEYGSYYIGNLQFKAGADQKALHVDLGVQQVKSGPGMAIYGTRLTGNVADNTIDYTLTIEDNKAKNKYRFSGLVRSLQNAYILSLKPGDLLLNYANWNVPDSNSIRIGKKVLHVSNFALERSGQSLSIRSLAANDNAPIEVDFNNFRIATITGFARTDSLLADGILNGNAVLHDIFGQPVFTSDLNITNLSIKKDTVGDVAIKLNNKVQNTYSADVRITGRGNDILLNGEYYALKDNTHFALQLDIRQLQLNTIQGATMGAIREASGSINGKLGITGTMTQPVVEGDLNFNKAAFTISKLNNYFLIDQQKLNINPQGIKFNDFTIKDSAGNYASLDGNLYTTNFRNYRFDLNFYAEDFRLLNSTKQDNQLFYGKLYFNSDINLQGTEKQPSVDGDVVINDKTKLTVVLPQQEPGVVERKGIIEFISPDSSQVDSMTRPYQVVDTASIKGMNVSMNVEINKNAELNLIIDQGNGDFLRVKGEATLNAGIDAAGKITLTGAYELNEGAYELSFNFLHRKFNIQKGSRIVWSGSPTGAEVNVTAIYIANTSPLDLVEGQLAAGTTTTTRNMFLQKLPFEVHLNMTGQLLTPTITFDIVLPSDKNYNMGRDLVDMVETRLNIIRQEPEEINKQVFALLLLNRFVGEDPFASSGGGMTAESFARQSASKILTDQLNRLAAQLVQGVDINFDVVSSNDYSTGQRSNRTDLNVGLSKRLLNDRLTVTVGSNFELEGARNQNQNSNNIAGDVAVNYQLSKDGRYMLRAYRKNQYEGVIDGYVIETGIGFIITFDYERLRDLFNTKKDKKQKRGKKEMPSTE